ncbi:hypothetical protein TMPK1_22110 [Rhodospirillales bacterium TMPK1]|uniref:HTH lysR-type domain-containing protein n=1 Tax=Roseiterribacter gracilis TaxID=2812848 RepID=A0A8S8XB49_9PROT|nr:hypothetical protein TMPK1_22110 [Rhodospirillales bacterium TMPK1]
MRNLEEHYGVRLFVRDGRSVRLTKGGEALLDSVRPALLQLEDASRSLLQHGRTSPTELRVSAPPLFISTILIPNLGTFEKRLPSLTLRIEASENDRYLDAVSCDFAIRFGRFETFGLHAEPLLAIGCMPVCAPSLHAALQQSRDGLWQQTLIHVEGHPRAWADWFGATEGGPLRPGRELWFDSTCDAIEAAEHGLGVALAPSPLIERRRGFGQTLVAAGPVSGSAETIQLATRSDIHDAPWAWTFREWLAASVLS